MTDIRLSPGAGRLTFEYEQDGQPIKLVMATRDVRIEVEYDDPTMGVNGWGDLVSYTPRDRIVTLTARSWNYEVRQVDEVEYDPAVDDIVVDPVTELFGR